MKKIVFMCLIAMTSTLSAAKNQDLLKAAREGSIKRVEEALEPGLLTAPANVNYISDDGKTPLSEACAGGNPAVVMMLLERGADASLENMKALFAAVSRGEAKIVQMVVKAIQQSFKDQFIYVQNFFENFNKALGSAIRYQVYKDTDERNYEIINLLKATFKEAADFAAENSSEQLESVDETLKAIKADGF